MSVPGSVPSKTLFFFLPFQHTVIVNVDNQPIVLQLCDTAGQVKLIPKRDPENDFVRNLGALRKTTKAVGSILIEVTLMRMLSSCVCPEGAT